MALISCPECGKEISDKAVACPHCGNPMNPQVQQTQQEEYLCCPKCGSRELHAEHKGFSGGKALAGVLVTGGIGLLAGTIGSRNTQITCLKCGKKFKAGEARVVRTPSNVTLSASPMAMPTKHVCGICGYIYDGGMVPAKCPICKAPAEKFQPLYGNTNDTPVAAPETPMKKQFTCGVCGYIYDGDTAPEKCPICKASAEHFGMQEVPATSTNVAGLPNTANASGNGCSIIVLIGISLTLGALALI